MKKDNKRERIIKKGNDHKRNEERKIETLLPRITRKSSGSEVERF